MEGSNTDAPGADTDGPTRLARFAEEESGPLYAFFRRATGDAELAQDLLQDTLMDAWRHIHQYDASRSLRGWIFRIGQNRLRNLLRRRKLERQWIQPLDGDPVSGPGTDECRGEQTEAIDRALLRLSIAERVVLLLRYQEGLTCAEAGEVLGITANAVSIQLHHSRKRLREILATQSTEKKP